MTPERPCFICRSEEYCAHREPEIEAALLERYLGRLREVQEASCPIESDNSIPRKTADSEQGLPMEMKVSA